MRLAELVATSRRVADTRSRREKIAALAELLRRLAPEEIEIAVAYLSGQPRQRRIGLGPATLAAARPAGAAAAPRLTLVEVDAAFARMAAASGGGPPAPRGRRRPPPPAPPPPGGRP